MAVVLSLSPTEVVVAQAMAKSGRRIDMINIGRDTAMCQDAGIDSIDVWDFIVYLGDKHRYVCKQVPWERFSDQRASFYGCGVLIFPFWLLHRVVTWPVHREALIPPPRCGDERLTVAHLAAVLERGGWFEPATGQ